jgi:2-haloacid dehalogenase
MSSESLGERPEWLTFDCYGTLIQWDEGLTQAVGGILRDHGVSIDAGELIRAYDGHEHALEEERPHRSFREVAAEALRRAMAELGLAYEARFSAVLTSSISAMPPFPEVVPALAALKRQGFRLCIISNTDDDIIAGNVAQLGGHIDRVVTAQQAEAYKPSRRIFAHAHAALGVTKDQVVHICASPHLDLVAARDIGFRCIWIDRGSGRKPLPDYEPNRIFPSLDKAPAYFAEIGWA